MKPRVRAGWVSFLLISAGIFVLAERFRLAIVLGESMRPTFKSGDLMVVDSKAFHSNPPREADVVLVLLHNGYVLKRIVGLPGQIVEVKSGLVYVDDVARVANYPVISGDMDIRPGLLAPGSYAILGDNRTLSSEPTVHAVITRNEIVGKVVAQVTLWPERWRRQ